MRAEERVELAVRRIAGRHVGNEWLNDLLVEIADEIAKVVRESQRKEGGDDA